jgi:hypothetical protein
MKPISTLLAALSNQIRLLLSKLGKVPALIYFSGYLIVIFVFSLIYYYALPGKHFYHSTTQYEYQFFSNDVADPILHDLRADIIQAYQKNGKAKEEINGWRVVVDNLYMDFLDTGSLPSEFSFQITIPINDGTEGNWDSWTFLTAKITVFADGKFVSNDVVYSPYKIETPYTSQVQGIPAQIPSPGVIFNYELIQRERNNGENEPIQLQRPGENEGMFLQQHGVREVLPLSLNVYDRIIELGQGFRGFSSKVSGLYLRMLYFSAGIASSSALGDIVPVSSQARLSVTSEVIIVVIFIGLFLNSLAYGIGEALKSVQGIEGKTDTSVSDTNKKQPIKRVADRSRDSAASQKESKSRKNLAPKQNTHLPSHRQGKS